MQQLSLVGIALFWAYASLPCISLPWPHPLQVSGAALEEIGDQGSSPAKTEVSQKKYKRSLVAEEVEEEENTLEAGQSIQGHQEAAGFSNDSHGTLISKGWWTRCKFDNPIHLQNQCFWNCNKLICRYCWKYIWQFLQWISLSNQKWSIIKSWWVGLYWICWSLEAGIILLLEGETLQRWSMTTGLSWQFAEVQPPDAFRSLSTLKQSIVSPETIPPGP